MLLNYTARRRDVLTLAHELGHGVHFALAARQGIFHQSTPLTLAETASVFGETIVFGRLLEEDSDTGVASGAAGGEPRGHDRDRLSPGRDEPLRGARAHERREQGELSVERLGELWAESQSEMFGDSVELTDGYRTWWSYIPHFIGTPGYVYAYAYGQLLALSVYERYEQTGAELVPRYLELLAAGGSRAPEELGGIVGIDLADPGFWDSGARSRRAPAAGSRSGGRGVRAPELSSTFAGRTVLVTGASRGIGLATARRFAALGAQVALVASNAQLLAEVAKELDGSRRTSSRATACTRAPRSG